MTRTGTEPKVRINTKISGQPAEILLELKRRGLVTSNTDAIIQALMALYEKVVDRDLRAAQLRTLKEAGE
jgi:hypothetical protein